MRFMKRKAFTYFRKPVHKYRENAESEGICLFDHGLGVLEKYGLTAAGSCRGRGALICQTDQGLKVIREYRGSLEKLKVQRKIQQQAEADGKLKTDLPLLNLEGEAATLHTDGLPVSYTHLDVYKRQLGNRGRRRFLYWRNSCPVGKILFHGCDRLY